MRVGVVRYLNARPLWHGLGHRLSGVTLVEDVPSQLAELLRHGALDVALIPSIEYARHASLLEVIPGFAIASRGPVHSVRLYARTPFDRIERLALDEGSRTSQVLARVWLAAAHGVRPAAIESLPLDVPLAESSADALLVIGDRAMVESPGPYHAAVDLGQAWTAWTGLPFVFALWVARRGLDLHELIGALEDCRDDGLAHAAAIAAEHGPRLGLDTTTAFNYLTRVISYQLGDAELAGLRRFLALAADLNLAPNEVDLVFHSDRLDSAARR